MGTFERTIKYESDLDHHFAQEIMAIPGGESLTDCIQCGNCSGICPLSIYMDYTPRRIIAMTREGFKKEVLSSRTIWLCASCYACTVHCPANIKITDIMYALKRKAIREKVYPRGFTIPILAKTFYEWVKSKGRNSESWIVLNTYLRSSPLKLLGMASLGLKLMRKGRMSWKSENIKNTREFAVMLDSLKEDGK